MGAAAQSIAEPMAKIGRFFQRPDYFFALRFWLATLLAWAAAFSLQLDKPYWAIMTVAVVSYPSQGMLIAKFIARLAGTVVGILMVTWLAGISLNAPWLMSLYLALWLSLCTYIAGRYSGMVTYGCALCGYTSAIVGFGISVSPTPYTLFFISQARLSEIALGLAAALLVTFALPSRLDNRLFLQAAQGNSHRMRDLFQSCLHRYVPERALFQRWYELVTGLMNAELLAANNSLSAAADSTLRRRRSRLTRRQLSSASGLLSLHSMSTLLLHDSGADAGDYLNEVEKWLGPRPFPPDTAPPWPPDGLMAHRAGQHFCLALRSCLDDAGAEAAGPAESRTGQVFAGARVFRDSHEMLLNAVRTFCSVLAGVFFWLGNDWDMGYILTVLIGISCALGAHYPAVSKLVLVVLAAVVLAVPVAYVLLFYAFISTSELLPAMLAMTPALLLAGAGKSLSPVAFIFFHVFMLGVIFLINFANPMDYDFSRFANMAVAAVFSVLIVAVVFYFIPQSADRVKLVRMTRAISGRFTGDMAREARHGPFEDYVYSALFLTRVMPRSPDKQRFVRFCCVILAMSRIRSRAGRRSPAEPFFPAAFIDALMQGNYALCLALTETYMAKGDDRDWGYWWETGTVLRYLL